MDRRLTALAMLVGGWVGGMVPYLWGDSGFSVAGILFSAAGAALGIWLAFRASR